MHVSQPIIIDTINNLKEIIDCIMDIRDYYDVVLSTVSNCEVLAILNDFNSEELFELSIKSIKGNKRCIIMLDANNPKEVLMQRLIESEKNGACAVGIDFSSFYNINSRDRIQIDIPIIIKGISSDNDINKINSLYANGVYFSNNNKYSLKGMEKVADTISRVALNFNNNHKMQLTLLAESPKYGVDAFKYFMLGANAVCVTNESFISAISKGIKGLEYSLYSNKIELEKIMKVFGQSKLRYNNEIWHKTR